MSIERIIERIVAITAGYYGISKAEIYGRSRATNIVTARHMAYLLAYNSGMSFTEIGKRFKRDHTTIMHGVDRMSRRVVVYKAPRDDFDTLKRLLEEHAA